MPKIMKARRASTSRTPLEAMLSAPLEVELWGRRRRRISGKAGPVECQMVGASCGGRTVAVMDPSRAKAEKQVREFLGVTLKAWNVAKARWKKRCAQAKKRIAAKKKKMRPDYYEAGHPKKPSWSAGGVQVTVSALGKDRQLVTKRLTEVLTALGGGTILTSKRHLRCLSS